MSDEKSIGLITEEDYISTKNPEDGRRKTFRLLHYNHENNQEVRKELKAMQLSVDTGFTKIIEKIDNLPCPAMQKEINDLKVKQAGKSGAIRSLAAIAWAKPRVTIPIIFAVCIGIALIVGTITIADVRSIIPKWGG